MDTPLDAFWTLRLADVAERLTDNNFEAHVVQSLEEPAITCWPRSSDP
jgi:hypothetical protein